jgi:hypothetical protein
MENISSTGTPVKKKKIFRKLILFSILIFTVGFCLFVFIAGFTYSEGTRSGVLTKVSERGFIFKTYEGEINIGGLNDGDGTLMPVTIFKFSTQDPRVYYKLESLQGKKVIVHYKQVIKNFFWQGDTDYFIDSVEKANNL